MSSLWFQDPNGPSAECLISFHDCVLILIFPIAIGVLGFILSFFYKLFSYRLLLENQALEFTWTLLPALSLLLLAAPSLSLLYLLDEVGFPASTTKVFGHQWYWVYEQNDISCSSTTSYISSVPIRNLSADTSLSVSSGLVLRLLISSADVLHSWTIPSWGLKADAVPGRLNQLSTILDRAGLYYGQCSEICGSNHSFMPIMAEVLS